ncbi:MAG: adenylate kinase [Ignavibacteria bacterium]|nr:adenylate kinase [Ignavibacteria bacterium]
MHKILIFGAPGVGKGTQSQLLSEKLNLYHLSTGEVLREAISEGTELGIKAKKIVESGHLVSDDLMIGIVHDALKNRMNSKDGFILDGFPRTIDQAKALDGILKELGLEDLKILHLVANDDEIIKRLMLRGRTDDNAETIKLRLNLYLDSTKPILEYYKPYRKIIEVNGIGEIEEVFGKILSKLQ